MVSRSRVGGSSSSVFDDGGVNVGGGVMQGFSGGGVVERQK